MVPDHAEKPADARIKSGRYVKQKTGGLGSDENA